MAGRAVVTGIGVIAPNGLGLEEYWSATLRGETGIRPIRRFDPATYPVRLAGEVTGFEPKDHLPSRLIPQTDRMTQFAVAAADWALADAGADPAGLDPRAVGVATASASGGFDFGQRELQKLWGQGPGHVSAYMSFAWFYAVNTGQISIRHDLRGPAAALVSEQAGGLDAVAHARRGVRRGAPLMITGGMDSALSPYGLAALIASGRLSGRDEPARAYVPFAEDACGHLPGEGGAILVLEDAARAAERGARVYGEIAGYAATFDPPPASGRGSNLRRAIEGALADAGAAPDEIGVVFADAAADPELDRAEADALAAVFGPRGVPVTAPKTLTGRLYSGAAPLDLALAFKALGEGLIPPAGGGPAAARYGVDLVTGAPRPLTRSAALVLARGFGGFNSAMVVRSDRAREGER
ncbi:ketosynthase chain-length factor [Spirillospora sp. NPDC047279]|uniref:ketosynthase chain-length factor n=1 Tax=Spirillospora sp. NPDC047279 TaxID=3155478 RepID=UPI0033F7DE35